jgi:hypothetical protein
MVTLRAKRTSAPRADEVLRDEKNFAPKISRRGEKEGRAFAPAF